MCLVEEKCVLKIASEFLTGSVESRRNHFSDMSIHISDYIIDYNQRYSQI